MKKVLLFVLMAIFVFPILFAQEKVLGVSKSGYVNISKDSLKPPYLELVKGSLQFIDDVANNKIKAVFSSFSGKSGTFIDLRDGKEYKWIRLGQQIWMAENLNIGKNIYGKYDMKNNQIIEKYCYNNKEENCNKYGGLYQWGEMMQHTTTQGTQGICPTGWHIPTDDEWKTLEVTVDSQYGVGCLEWDGTEYRGYDAGKNLKSTSDWCRNGNGSGSYSYRALPGGYCCGRFVDLGCSTYFWSSSEHNSGNAWSRHLDYYYAEVYRGYYSKGYGFSVRCVKDTIN